jgi:hypothetical protein
LAVHVPLRKRGQPFDDGVRRQPPSRSLRRAGSFDDGSGVPTWAPFAFDDGAVRRRCFECRCAADSVATDGAGFLQLV